MRIMCDDDTQHAERMKKIAARAKNLARTAPQPPSDPAVDSGGSGSQEGRIEHLLHAMHDACKFAEGTTRAILEGVLHDSRYGARDRDYRGNRCHCPHCEDEYRRWEPPSRLDQEDRGE